MPTMTVPLPDASPSPAKHALIEARSLGRRFGPFRAVSELTFAIPAGRLVAFLGPNGAGKSTTMRMLTGYLAPTEGSALIGGLDIAVSRTDGARLLGYLPENGPLYPDMTPIGTLRFVGAMRGLAGAQLRDRIDWVLDRCRLGDVVRKPVAKLSKGYRQRVGLALALLHDPDVLILDEPTAGLDPNQVDQVRTVLRELARTKAVLLSTHILSEVRALADRILVISRGRLVHDGPAGSLGPDERAIEERFRSLTAPAPAGSNGVRAG